MKIRLYDLLAYHKPSGHVHRWHVATAPGYRSRSDDTPASVTWLPLVGQWASVAVMAAGGSGGSRVQIDDLRLINVRAADDLPRWANVYDVTAASWIRVPLGRRPLNPLLSDYVIQAITEREVEEGASYSSAVTIWQAKAGILAPARTELRLPVYDRQLDFDAPVQTTRYGGGGGYDGPAELKDALKERALGWCPMVQPTYLGIIGGYHRWSVNGGDPVDDVPRGWSAGVAMSKVAYPPAANTYSVDVSTGYITTISKYDDFRVEVKGWKPAGVWHRHIGDLIAYLATSAGLATVASVSGMDAPTPRTVGLYLPAGAGTTHREVYDRFVGSVPRGRWFVEPQADQLVVTRLPRASAATPTRTYRKAAGETPGLKPLSGNAVVPAKQAIVLYAQNPSPGTSASDATAADAALWSQPWRESASGVNDTVADAWGVSARVERVETCLTLPADADAEAPLWLAELSDPPQPYELKVQDGAPGLWIGGAVSVVDDLAGFETGGTVVVYGRTNRDRGGGATLYVER